LSTRYDPEKDYYEVLGVDQNASAGQIRKSYINLAKRHHPDANLGNPSDERFKEISEAYDVLSDDQRRPEYDQARSSPGTRRTVFTPPPPPSPRRRRSGKGARMRLIGLSISTVTALVLLVLGLTAFSSAPGPPVPGEPAVSKAEAAAVNSVVNSSASSQAEFLNAINNVNKCTGIASSVRQISQVLGQRASELSEASGLATRALRNGLPLRSYLVETIRISQHSDEIFLRWAEEVSAHGCTPPNLHSSVYNEGATLFQDAVVAEVNFIAFWNPVASKNGFQPRSKANF
jgi:hypothetical protein